MEIKLNINPGDHANGAITGGSIMFDGKDLTKLTTDKDWEGIRGKQISTIFQDPMTSDRKSTRLNSSHSV